MKAQNIIIGSPPSFPLLLILGSILWTCSVSACTIECSSTASACIVCFRICEAQENTFHNCSQLESTEPSQNNHHNTMSQDSVYVFQEEECAQKCCSNQLSPFGNRKFSQCKEKTKEDRIKAIVIGCVTTVLVLSVCLCCWHPKLREKVAACLCPQAIKMPEPQLEHRMSEIALDNAIEVDSKNSSIIIFGSTKGKECIVCLSEQCNVSSECGHCFHLHCLQSYYNQHKICPECQRSEIDTLQLYCEQCLRPLQKEIRLSHLHRFNINVSKESICPSCAS